MITYYKITLHGQEYFITVDDSTIKTTSSSHPWMLGRTLSDVTNWVRRGHGHIIRIEAPTHDLGSEAAEVVTTPVTDTKEKTSRAPSSEQEKAALLMVNRIQDWLASIRAKSASKKEENT